MNGTGLRMPPVVGLLVRGYAVVASIVALQVFGFLPDRSLAIFLVSMTSIAMVFGIGHLLVAAKRPLKKASLDMPSMIILYAGGGFVMYFVSLLAERGILRETPAFILLAACSLALSFAGIGGYISEIASNVKCTLERPPKRRPVRAR
ncbi:MAG: hypothetical protein V1934_00105 [Methanobacteriota archaeon]